MKYKAIIFDCDGTLLDTIDDLSDALNYTLHRLKLKELNRYDILHMLGTGISGLIKQALGDRHMDMYEEAFALFNVYYNEHFSDKTMPYDGIMDLLSTLSLMNYKMALVSNKNSKFLTELYRKFFKDTIHICVGETSDLRKKPSPDMIEFALKLLNVRKEDALYVGDSEVDVLTAQNSGLKGIFVSWGFRTKEELISCGANVIINAPHELLEFLN